MSCGVGHRLGLDLVLLWLWCRPAATALIRPLVWEPSYATGVALKRQKTEEKKKKPRIIINETEKRKSIEKINKAKVVFWFWFYFFKRSVQSVSL